MRITQFTDYSLRVLIYLGLKGEKATVTEISKSFRISRNHLVKVVHALSLRGYVNSFTGRNGGVELALEPSKIIIGRLVEELEPMELLECFNAATNTCPIRGVCQLEGSLVQARNAFLESLKTHTLADFLTPGPSRSERMRRLKIVRKV